MARKLFENDGMRGRGTLGGKVRAVMGRAQRTRARAAAACALRLLVTFTLAFSFTLGAQVAYATGTGAADAGKQVVAQGDPADTGGTGGENPTPTPTPTPDPEPEPQPDPEPDPQPDPQPEPTKPAVTDLGIYVKPALVGDPINVLSTALSPQNPPAQHQAITARGGTLDFDAVAYWTDYSENYDFTYVRWALDPGNEAIARIDSMTGLLTANGSTNGTVVVTCTLDEGYGQDGQRWQTKVAVDVTGQEQAPFVTSIVLCDESGVQIGTPEYPSYTFVDETLATAMIELQAKVIVRDPLAGADTEYTVKAGNGLSKQTGGRVADLTWYCMVPEMGTVSDDGIYRPTREGNNVVYAVGLGENAAAIEYGASIIMPGEGEAHPQDSLKVDVVWSDYPDVVVAEKTFSVADMEALGTVTQSYTAFGGTGPVKFKSYTGRGPLLVNVLKAVGVDTENMSGARLRFDSIDNPREVSWDMLVDETRCYYPNAPDIYGGRQVAPMMAIESAYAGTGVSAEVPEKMTSDERFRLLFGANSSGETTTDLQRKWVNAIHVILPGSPPPPKEDDPAKEDRTEKEQQDEAAIGGGMNTAGGGGDNAGTPTSSGGSGNNADGSRNSNPGAWSVLSAVNKNASDVAGLDLDNPFGPFTGAMCVGFFVAGGAEAFGRWRWQKRMPNMLVT